MTDPRQLTFLLIMHKQPLTPENFADAYIPEETLETDEKVQQDNEEISEEAEEEAEQGCLFREWQQY